MLGITGLFTVAFYTALTKKWLLSVLSIITLLIWLCFSISLLSWLNTLGADSFAELNLFDPAEGHYYIKNTVNNVDFIIDYTVALYGATLALIFYYPAHVLIKTNHRRSALILMIFIIINMLAASGYFFLSDSLSHFMSNSQPYFNLKKNFSHPTPNFEFSHKNLKLVVYIGESTSIMNMGVYGYPRDTTPYLSQLAKSDQNFLLFKNIFSTHTHTAPSLLEAFSFGLDKNEEFLPIQQRQRISLIDILVKANIPTYLFSTQASTGTYNLANSVAFANAIRVFSEDTRMMSYEYLIKVQGGLDKRKTADHKFFRAHLKNTLAKIGKQQGVVLLHSYAGHAKYDNHIPEQYRKPLDTYLKPFNWRAIQGNLDKHLRKAIEAYDSAIRYVDFSVSGSVETVKSHKEPIVFMYFSDHGDSVYTGRYHDSSRFYHEMLRVPFFLYFNEAAKVAYPDLYTQYNALSHQGNIATLAQLASTIVNLLGGEPVDSELLVPVIGKPTQHPPILVREQHNFNTYLNLNDYDLSPSRIHGLDRREIKNYTDNITRIFLASHYNKNNNEICYHRANSLSKILRGRLVSGCMELDIEVNSSGAVEVNHPPAEKVRLTLQHMIDIAQKNDLSLWLDAKNIDVSENCVILSRLLNKATLPKNKIFIEFPSTTPFDNPEIITCAKQLRKNGMKTSYYVPTNLAKECTNHLTQGRAINGNKSCKKLETLINAAHKSEIFSDISFDYSAIDAIEQIHFPLQMHWNTWNVAAKKLHEVDVKRFNRIILYNNDINSR